MIASLIIGLYSTDFLDKWEFVGLHWYRSVLTDKLVHKAFLNTAYFSFATVPLNTLLALIIAVMPTRGFVGRVSGVRSTICPRLSPAWQFLLWR